MLSERLIQCSSFSGSCCLLFWKRCSFEPETIWDAFNAGPDNPRCGPGNRSARLPCHCIGSSRAFVNGCSGRTSIASWVFRKGSIMRLGKNERTGLPMIDAIESEAELFALAEQSIKPRRLFTMPSRAATRRRSHICASQASSPTWRSKQQKQPKQSRWQFSTRRSDGWPALAPRR
jgi:hypothetical protein